MATTHTLAKLPLSKMAFEEIERKLLAAGYEHAFHDDGDGITIDMTGIGVELEREISPISAPIPVKHPKPICVLAGTMAQYHDWLRENGQTRNSAIYIAGPDNIRGFEFSKIEIIGTFWHRPDAGRLHDLAVRYVR